MRKIRIVSFPLLIFFLIALGILSGFALRIQEAQAAITYQTPGAIAYSAAGGTSVAPAYPASIAAGDLLVLIIGMKPSTANSGSVTTPSGWTAITSITGAGGYGTTLGADTGNTNLFTFYKVATGSESGSLTVTLATNNVSWAQMYRFSNATGLWSVAGTTGSDTTAGNVSITFASDPGVTAADYILGAMCIPTDITTPTQFSAEALSQSGITFGAVTEISEPDSITGNDIGGVTYRAPVNSGTSTGVPTFTATAGGTTTNVRGPGVFIRIRELLPGITITSSTNQPSSVLVGDTDIVMGSVSIKRNVSSNTVTAVTLKENGGTIDAQNELANVELWLSSDDTWDSGDNRLDSAKSFDGADGECTFTETFDVTTTLQYLIVRLDVLSSATTGNTIEVRVSTVTASDPVNGIPCDITGTTTVNLPSITVASSIAQPPNADAGCTDKVMGVASIVRDGGTGQVTAVTLKENGGTIDAQNELSNIELWLSSDTDWDSGDEQLDTAKNFNGADGECTFTENFDVTVSTQYLIIRLDVASGATVNDTIEVRISTVTTSDTVNGTPCDISGTTTVTSDWWNASWSHRKELTFDNTAQTENLTYFPVMVKLTPSRINYSDFGKSDGTDLRFIDSDNSTELKYHIEEWNSSGDSFIWVRVPQIDGSSKLDFIYMYYGNASATDVQSSTSTFSNNYRAVWHMDEDLWNGTPNEVKDSTVNGIHGAGGGNATTTNTGKIGRCGTFDGAGDYVDLGTDVLRYTVGTLSAWANFSDSALANMILSVHEGIDTYDWSGFRIYLGNLQYYCRPGTVVKLYFTSDDTMTQGVWNYVAYVTDGSGNQLYINGEPAAATYTNGNSATNAFYGDITTNQNTKIGLLYDYNGAGLVTNEYKGTMDEVRFSTVRRSDDWIRAQYKSMNDTFITWPAFINVAPSSAQPSSVAQGCVDKVMGSVSIGKSVGSGQVTAVTLKENGGTIDAQNELSNIELWLSSDDTWDLGDNQLDTAKNFNGADGECTFNEGFVVTSSNQYLIVRLDVASGATLSDTIEIQVKSITTTDDVSGIPCDISDTSSVVAPSITVDECVSQPGYAVIPSIDNVMGVASIVRTGGTSQVTAVTFKENGGTIDAQNELSNIELWLSSDTIRDAGDEQLSIAQSFNGVDGECTFTETFDVTTTAKYLIARLDVASGATSGDTIEIRISTITTTGSVSGIPLDFTGYTTTDNSGTLPDFTLTSSDISFSAQPHMEGQDITITAVVLNDGANYASSIGVKFYDGDPDLSGSVYIDSGTISSLNSGATAQIQITWTCTYGGDHDIFAYIDADKAIDEEKDNNNKAYKTITVGAANYWISDTAGNWSNAGNWSLGAKPVQGDYIVFNNLYTGKCTIDENTPELGRIIIDFGAGEIVQNGNVTITGDYIQSEGKFTCSAPQTYSFSAGGDFSIPTISDAFRRASGSGTPASPYRIYDVYGLQALQCGSDSYFELGNNIDAGPSSNWDSGKGFRPITFTGTFDGRNHTITGVYINRPSSNSQALFSSITTDATVKNLGLIDTEVHGTIYTGSLASALAGTIINCYSENAQVSGTGQGVGGLVGAANGSSAAISKCYATGSVDGTGQEQVGGLVGYAAAGAYISNSYSHASVSGDWKVGGFTGGLDALGGNTTVSKCYSTGEVTYTTDGGGFNGHAYEGPTIGYCYWDTQTSGQSTSHGGTGKTTAEMKQQATFVTWDFTSIWSIIQNQTYPYLQASGIVWDGGGADNNWSTAANWVGDTVPGGTDNVIFNATSNKPCTINTSATVANFSIVEGSTITITASANLTVTGNFSLSTGTFNAGSTELTIGGDWSLTTDSTFSAQTSTVTFNSLATAELTGNITFYCLKSTQTFKTIKFSSNIVTYVTGHLDFENVTLRSTLDGATWYLNLSGTQDVFNVDVKDSNASGSTINATNSTDSGNNTNWNFPINNIPTLAWTGDSGYGSDGIEPDIGESGSNFEFRVKYTDLDNQAPQVKQVWVDENDNGSYESDEKYDMSVMGGEDGDYTNGERYTKTLAISHAGDGILKYRFYFSDGIDPATGTPNDDHTFEVYIPGEGGSSSQSNTLRLGQDRHTFYDGSYYWAFYINDDGDVVYKKSSDGVNWNGAPTTVDTGDYTSLGIWEDGTYIYCSYSDGTNSYERKITISNGNLGTERTITTSAHYHPQVVKDSNNYLWRKAEKEAGGGGGLTDGMNASNVLGQSDFTSNGSATSQSGMYYPTGACYDATGNRLFVADSENHRVLVFDGAEITDGENAINVLGQSNFTSNGFATTQNGMYYPRGVCYDATGNRLFVADEFNNRVLVFNLSSGITNGMNASNVLGQSNFTSGDAATTQSGMNGPHRVYYDSTNSRLFVADTFNNRVLVFNLSSGITNGMNASNVLGQSNFTSSGFATTQTGMFYPRGACYDATGNRLFVADQGNNRVTVFDLSSGITNGMNASNVLGQSNFTSNGEATTQSGMYWPYDVSYDATGNRLFVADQGNNRVTVFDVSSINDGENAINVLGQSLFTTNTSATTQSGMNSPRGICYDSTNSRLFVADRQNNRVTVFNLTENPAAFYAQRSTNPDDDSFWQSESSIGEDTSGYGHMQLVPLDSQKMIALYNDYESSTYYLRYSTYNASWGSEQTVVTDCKDNTAGDDWDEEHYFSAITDSSNKVHLIYIDTNDDLKYCSYDGTWSSTSTIQTGTLTHPTLSYNSSNNDLYAIWIDSPTATVKYKKYNGSSWDETATSLESGLTSPSYLGSAYSDSSNIGVIWREGTSSPYTVSYGKIELVPPDTTAPAAVTTLSALTGTYEGEINLSWTSPGDDGWNNDFDSGSEFDIRYSTTAGESPAISTTTFSACSSVSEFSPIPTPVTALWPYSMTVTGLTPGTTYYFAMKTADEVPNWSGLSNGATTWAKIVEGANRYWVGESNPDNWNDPNNWSATSGGGGGAGVPGADDTAIFDGGNIYSCQIDISSTVASVIIYSTYTATISINSGKSLTASGSFEIAGGTFTTNGEILDVGSYTQTDGIFNAGGSTVTCNGDFSVTVGTFNAGASVLVLDATDGDATFTGGGYTFNNVVFQSTGTVARTWILGGGTITFNGDFQIKAQGSVDLTVTAITNNPDLDIGGSVDYTGTGTGTESISMGESTWTVGGNVDFSGGTVDESTSTFVLNGSSTQTLTMDGNNLNILQITNSSSDGIYFADNLTLSTFTATTGNTHLYFCGGSTFTFTNINFNGQSESSRIVLRSTSTGTAWYLTVTGNQSVSYVDVRDSDASGGNTIDADDGTNKDSGNNVNWNFEAPGDRYWVASSAGNWYDPDNWSTSSGGAPPATVPSSSNKAIFDGAGLGSCSIDVDASVTDVVIYSTYTATVSINTSQSLTTSSSFSITGGTFTTNGEILDVGSYNQTGGIFNAGGSTITCNSDFSVTVGTFNAGASVLVLDAIDDDATFTGDGYTFNNVIFQSTGTVARTWTLGGGTITFNGDFQLKAQGSENLTVTAITNNPDLDIDGSVDYTGTGAGTEFISMGEGTWTVGGNVDFSDGTVDASTSTFVLKGASTQTLTMDGNNLNILQITNSSSDGVYFADNLTLSTFTATTGNTHLYFCGGSTFTFTNIELDGQSESSRIVLRSTSTNTAWYLTVTGTQSVSYVDVEDSDASGGDTILAIDGTSVNSGNNVKWDFGPPAAINDLSGQCDSDTGNVTLSWSTPGDDDWTGTLPSGSEYIIDYSTYSIAWSTSTYDVEISTSGVAPHTQVSYTITGLTGGTTWYFQIWTRDEVPTNWSGLSNGATVWVNPILSVSISTDTYNFGELNASTAAVSTANITVTNDGNVTETYSIKCSSFTTHWLLKDAPGNDEFAVQAAFHDDKPDNDDISWEDDILTKDLQPCTTEAFSIDNSQNGKDVQPFTSNIRDFWLRIKTPLSTSTTTQQDITVTISAEQGSP